MELPLTTPAVIGYTVFWIIVAAMLFRDRGVLLRGIPRLSASAVGLWRIVFGLTLVYAHVTLLSLPHEAAPSAGSAGRGLWNGTFGFVTYLTEHWNARDLVWGLTLAALVAWTAGLLARITYALAAAGVIVMILVAQEYGLGGHPWVIHGLVLVGLLIVPWGDGLSLDNVLRRRRGRPLPARPPGPHYGVAVWIPGLAMGTAFLAAAIAKVWNSGPEWVTEGAVRYHWAQDHLNAPVSLGAWIAGQEGLSIALSAAGVGIEALFITHVVFRGQWVRLAYGLAGVGLLLGFWLFQGVFWLPWWSLMLAFLPWQRLADLLTGRLPALTERLGGAGAGLLVGVRQQPRRWGLVLSVFVAFVLVQQVAVTRARDEQLPLFSNFPMYSDTQDSPEEFNRTVAPRRFYRYGFVAVADDGRRTPMDDRLDPDQGLGLALRDAFVRRTGPPAESLTDAMRQRLADDRVAFARATGLELDSVEVSVHARIFDFERGRLVTPKHPPPPVLVDLEDLDAEPVRGTL